MKTILPAKKYFGSKNLLASPCNLGDYNNYRGWKIPENENPEREGYVVQYQDGYESWSPKEVFESAYREIDKLTFGQAIEALKEGKKVARSGWNGKGMFVYLQKGFELKEPARNEILAQYQLENSNQPVTLCSHIDMKAADGSIVIGWLASQTDLLAEDWCILD